jgi:outer membrane protein TolC
VGTSTDVLDAQTLLTRAKSDYFNALSDYNMSIARLERAMGVREVLP